MKNKVVVWGANEQDEKVLIALELQADANKVMLYTFPEAIANEEFVNKMMNEWREDKPVEFPEGYQTIERELSVAESLLPDNLKVERSDVISRAQTEWHFAVLSSKLHAAYEQELAEFKEKVAGLTSYDGKMWDGLKTFWDKVQNQSRERNLFKQHADHLRDNINALFNDLKDMRSKVKNEFEDASQKVYDEFNAGLEDIEARINAGGSKLNAVFDELKQMQQRYRTARMTNEHRNQLWDRLDGAFKKAKERKFGPGANDGTVSDRHSQRLTGLLEAIKRMEDSIRRDEEDLNFQQKKVNTTEGQLEAQIRMAKIKMIEERLNGKRERLTEMNKTRSEVEKQAASAKNKEEKRAEKEVERQKFEAAKAAAKAEIAAGITTKESEKPKEDSLFEAATTVLGDVLMDALDTVKAVASVAADKAEAALEVAADKASAALEVAADKADEVIDEVTEKAGEVAEALTKPKAKKAEKEADEPEEKKDDATPEA